MWARHIEFMLGVWLAISWMIFSYVPTYHFLILHDLACFVLISLFALLSYLKTCRYLHLMNFIIGIWLIIFAYWIRTEETMHYAENYMCLGLLLLIFSVIPSHANLPPQLWEKFLEKSGWKMK